MPAVTPANLFKGSRQLCFFLPTHCPLLCCPNHGKPSLPVQPLSPCLRLIVSASLWLLLQLAVVVAMQLLLQIADSYAVAFASQWFALFALASMQTSLLLLLQVCEIYGNCFCASSWVASQLHLQCMVVLCGCSSCGWQASKWGVLSVPCFWCSHWKLVVALNGKDWGDSHGFIQYHVLADATTHQNK